MSMLEHRYKKRLQLSLDVVVRWRNGLKLNGKSRDFSTDGVFVQLATPEAVPASTVVKVELLGYGCLRGWVMHTGDEGIGVMFRSLSDKEHDFLKQLLSKATTTKCSVIWNTGRK